MCDTSIYIGNFCVLTKIMLRTKWTFSLLSSTAFLIEDQNDVKFFIINVKTKVFS